MKKLLAAGAVAGLILLGGGVVPASAAPAANQICPAGDSGKIDVTGNVSSIVLTADPGMLITSVCVKSGSANQGLGAVITTFDPGLTSVTIAGLQGKYISHYSYTQEPDDGGYGS